MGDSNRIEDYTHVGLLVPSNYLAAADLRDADRVVVIEAIEPRAELEMNKNGKVVKDNKPVVHLVGKAKGWVLNKTNARAIAKVLGPNPNQWIGGGVTIYPTRVKCGREMVDAIRVREEAPDPARVEAIKARAAGGTETN